jgi:peptidoglycan hydrolase-like protein with peptidoglycan-binding domain
MRKLIATTVAASMLLSTAVFAADNVAVKTTGVDVVAAATAETTTTTPSTTTSKTTTTTAKATQGTILTIGSQGAAVKELQEKLNALGYKLTVDGIYGNKTADAVKDFQSKNGLRADGIVGPKTMEKLAPATAEATPATPETPATPATPAKAPGIYPEVIASASVNLTTEEQLKASLGENGTWITTLGSDVTVANDLVWVGDIRKAGTTAPARKLGIYYHSSPNIGGELIFTLKVPNLIVKAENATVAYGTLDGNVKVEAKGFNLTYATITGNLEFATQEQYASAKFNEVVIKGDVIVAGNKLDSKNKPQTITHYAKYSDAATNSDMIKAAVTFKDGKPHDIVIDVLGPSYFMKPGILSSGFQGNWGKIAYSKAGQYVMVKPSEDRPADTILAWDKQISTLITEFKKAGYDISKFPTCERDASHPSVLDFNKMLDGKYAKYTVSETNGAIDGTKLKGKERSDVAKVDAITSVSVDVGKYLKLVDSIIQEGVK